MLPEQNIEMIWESRNKARFVDLGYCFTKIGDMFLVDIKHMARYSKANIVVECDYCGEKVSKTYSNYVLEKSKSIIINKDCCEKCIPLKKQDVYDLRRTNKSYIRKCNVCENEYDLSDEFFRKRGEKYGNPVFSYSCKECEKTKHREEQTLKPKKEYTNEQAINIYLNAVKLNETLPCGYWGMLSGDQAIQVFKCAIIYNYGNDLKESLIQIDNKTLIKLKLNTIPKPYGGIFNMLNNIYPNTIMSWELKSTSNDYWKDDSNKINALTWFVEQLIKDNVIESIDEIPKKISFKYFKDYKIQGLMANHFNSSIYNAFNFLFPDKWKPWEFNITPKGFYQKEENRKEVMEWFVEKLMADGTIMNIDEIPVKINGTVFRKYGLDAFASDYFAGSVTKAFEFLYPTRWYPWEFDTPPKFFRDKLNVKLALDWLVDKLISDGIIKELKDASNVVNYKTFENNRLISLLREYSNVESIFVENYPETFNLGDFSYIYSSDGIRLDSNEEYIVHEWLLKHFDKVQFNGNSTKHPAKWINEEFNESYIPDWIVDENIIVEHFGYYCPSSAKPRFINYIKKANRKIDYFSSLKDYSFVPLFSKDLHCDLNGLKGKMSCHIL